MSVDDEYGGYADNDWSLARKRGRERARMARKPTGADLIVEERQRQLDEEGWTTQNDLRYKDGELIRAALCYADSANPFVKYVGPRTWPWDVKWDKRAKHSTKRKLVIAGALLAAELDRLQAEEEN